MRLCCDGPVLTRYCEDVFEPESATATIGIDFKVSWLLLGTDGWAGLGSHAPGWDKGVFFLLPGWAHGIGSWRGYGSMAVFVFRESSFLTRLGHGRSRSSRSGGRPTD